MITSEKVLIQFKIEYTHRLEDKTLKNYIFAVEQLLTFCKSPFQIFPRKK